MKKKASVRNKRPRSLEHLTGPQVARFICAAYILVMLVAQLFTFEQFPALIGSIGVAGGLTVVVAITLVVAELLALPHLLSIPRLPGMLKKVSFVSVFVALLGLTILEVTALLAGQTVIFGATFHLPAGSWSLFMLTGLWVLAAWGAIGQPANTPKDSATP